MSGLGDRRAGSATFVFAAEPMERLENLATRGRAPVRLVAGTVLRIDAWRSRPVQVVGKTAPVAPSAPVLDDTSSLRRSPRWGAARSWSRLSVAIDKWALENWGGQEGLTPAHLERLILPPRRDL
ncbi:MAG: hypothetical protein JO337_02935 [Acidimicrobiales bacterium]|nr:hypothetical protein [Acidimicrobiales bacterium]